MRVREQSLRFETELYNNVLQKQISSLILVIGVAYLSYVKLLI